MSHRRLFSIFLVSAILAMVGPLWAQGAPPTAVDATIAYVVDGATAVLTDGTRVHYLGLEVPAYRGEGNPSEPLGRQAFELNKKLVQGKRVRLEFDVEQKNTDGDLLAYVHVDKYFVNASLVQTGYAKVTIRSPNTRFAGLFERLEEEAKAEGRGVWSLPQEPVPAFGNKDLEASGKAAPDAVTNKDLGKDD